MFKITQPGSYYLTSNVTGVAGKAGIEVTAPNVTIDLRGFELLGVPGSLAGIDLNAGGAFGPEAGLIVLPALILGALFVYFYTKKRAG